MSDSSGDEGSSNKRRFNKFGNEKQLNGQRNRHNGSKTCYNTQPLSVSKLKNFANSRMKNLQKRLKDEVLQTTNDQFNCKQTGELYDTQTEHSYHNSNNERLLPQKPNRNITRNNMPDPWIRPTPSKIEVRRQLPDSVTNKFPEIVNTVSKVGKQSVNDRLARIKDSAVQNNSVQKPCNTQSSDGSYWITTTHRNLNQDTFRNNNYISPLLKQGIKRNSLNEDNDECSPAKVPAKESISNNHLISTEHNLVNKSELKDCIDTNYLPHLLRNNSNKNYPINQTKSSVSRSKRKVKVKKITRWEQNVGDECRVDRLKEFIKTVESTPVIEDTVEKMDWANPDFDEGSESQQTSAPRISEKEESIGKSKDLCIVVDTNIFIQSLSKVIEVMKLQVTGNSKPVLLIPWMVITELDYMKDSCFSSIMRNNITKSIRFINTSLEQRNPRMKGQTVYEMDQQRIIGASPDDKIVSCCLQAVEKYETVILFSNDVNLKNKALINSITVASSNEIITKVMFKLRQNVKFHKIKHKMSTLWSSIICKCSEQAYGPIWTKMDLLSDGPWSLTECLKRFKKYWLAVYRETVMKQFVKAVDDLINFLSLNKCIKDDSEEYVEFMKMCIGICIFLKDIQECRESIQNTLNEVTKIG